MNQKQVIIVLFVFLSFSSKGQGYLGFEVGYSNNGLITDISNRALTQNQNSNSFGLGVLSEFSFNKSVVFQTGIQFLQKNYSFVRTGEFKGVYETSMNSYLQIPLAIQFEIYKRIKFAINLSGGFYGAYWISAKVKGAIPNIFNSTHSIDTNGQNIQYLKLTNYYEKKVFNRLKDNRFEIGWLMGIGTNYTLSKGNICFIKYDYYQSLTDQQKDYMIYQISKYNETHFISVGYFMKLRNFKF